jgi:X-Pro dipeptidyl-peptidase
MDDMRGMLRAVAALAALLVTTPAALAQAEPPSIVVEDGVTQPVFGYADAIRERVWVDTDFDSDRDGVNDVIAVDIMRPAATEEGLDVPVIIDDSPYYRTLGRGNESERKADVDGDGLLDRWPLFYDNYFVPRGYAVALVDMTGTSGSTGCPTIQGTTENVSGPKVIDWLNGRNTARDKDGNLVTVDWHNGKAAMIGKSYDGALAMAGAASGVDGLTTVVPISGPYNYYDYTRSNGIVMRGNNYLVSLARAITDDDPARQARCAPVWDEIAANDGDEHGDYTPFWHERNYLPDADRIKASVFLVHGLQDENVRPDHFSKYWAALTERDIPRKLWLSGSGHEEPFDFRRAEWVSTIHRWFDYWLQGYPNGIAAEPKVDVEVAAGVFEMYNDWPIPRTGNVNFWLRAGEGGAGTFALTPAQGAPQTRSFVDDPNQFEAAMVNDPTQPTANRLVFLSEPLEKDLRISGTGVVDLTASSSLDEAYFGAILVDYGPKTRISRTSDGVVSDPSGAETCWGESSATDDACYRVTTTLTTEADQWRVSKGILDGQNRNSYAVAEPLVPGEAYEISFPLLPNDYVFPAGNRIGVVLVGSYRSYSAARIFSRPTITVDAKVSRIALPVVGGHQAAREAGIPLR